MNEEIRAAMRQTYREMGEAILKDERRLASFLADILGNRYPGERLLLRQLVQTGLPRMIAEGRATADNLPDKAAYVSQTYFWDKDMTLAAACVWFETLKATSSPPERPAQPKTHQQRPSPKEFIGAAAKGDVQRVATLLAAGADVNAKNRKGATALIAATGYGHANCARLLIDAGADLNAMTNSGMTALSWAARKGHTDCVRLLIDTGADVNADDGEGATALMWAAHAGYMYCVRLLIDAGADLNAMTNSGMTALMFAVGYDGHADCAQLLVESGSYLNIRDDLGGTALMWAATYGHADCVRLLIENGADVNAKDNDGFTALNSAAEKGQADCVRLLLEAGTEMNAKNNDGMTALMEAARNGHADCVRLLIEAGADVNAKDEKGYTALMIAALNRHSVCVRSLIESGADVNAKDKHGSTALMVAAEFGRVDCVRLILESGAEVNAKDNNGLTALFVTARGGLTRYTALTSAAWAGHADCARLLIEAGADVNATDKLGRTVLSRAIGWESGRMIIALLREAGAHERFEALQGATKHPGLPKQPEPTQPHSKFLPTYTNSIGMEFVLIPAGTFLMGSLDDDNDASANEKPRHEVTISRPFYLGKYLVTQEQWQKVMASNPSRNKGGNCPVESVSWYDVHQYIEILNVRERHNRYRLPTEAEWEYACRAGSISRWCFGDDPRLLGDYAWYRNNSGQASHAVGQKRPNAWGLFDMHGNVWEWVQDRRGSYRAGSEMDPQGPSSGDGRVLRGGNYSFDAGGCRSASRGASDPHIPFDVIGFRLVLIPSSSEHTKQSEMSAEELFQQAAERYEDLRYDIAYHPDPDVAEEERAADFREVAMLFREAAEQGHPGAQYHLGEMYRDGCGVPQSDEQKARWWREAVKGYRERAEQGDATFQYQLGYMYEDGEVVPRDVEQAAYWYRKAAEQGDPNAMRFLGGMYEKGRGVPQDYEAAAFWYRKLGEVGVGHWAADDLRRLEEQGLIKKRG